MPSLQKTCHVEMTIYFFLGRLVLELAQDSSSTALAWHFAGRGAPLGVTYYKKAYPQLEALLSHVLWGEGGPS